MVPADTHDDDAVPRLRNAVTFAANYESRWVICDELFRPLHPMRNMDWQQRVLRFWGGCKGCAECGGWILQVPLNGGEHLLISDFGCQDAFYILHDEDRRLECCEDCEVLLVQEVTWIAFGAEIGDLFLSRPSHK